MIKCTKCDTKIRNENMVVYITVLDENDSIDVDVTCPKCGHGMWCRIHQSEFIDA